MTKLSVRVESFKPLRSNTLYVFADIVIPEVRLRVRETTVHQMDHRWWIKLPAKPQIDRNGVVRRDERGKIAYSAFLQFTDWATHDAFSQRAIAALPERFPYAFADGGAG
jgi:hypothetical protein